MIIQSRTPRVLGLLVVGLLVAGLALYASRPASAQNCNDADVLLYGMNIDPYNAAGNPTVSQLQTAGVRWVRMEFNGGLGYSFYDPVISTLRAGGIKVLIILDYATYGGAPGSSGSDGAWDTYITGFTAKVDEVATHYGSNVDAYQIWNEPDLGAGCNSGYDPCVPSYKYAWMLKYAHDAVRAHTTTSTVVSGSMASGNPAYVQDIITEVGAVYADVIAVHPYGQRAPDGWPNTSWGFGDMSDLFDNYLVYGKPLWVTEIGTVDTANEAQYLTNVYDLVKTQYLSQVPEVFWFCWSDGMVSPFGIVDSGGNPKAAYTSYQNSAPTWDPQCGGTTPVDADGDGYSPPTDCDDNNVAIHPGAAEICGNGIDEDCSGADLSCGGNQVTFAYDPAAPHALQTVVITVSGHDGYTNIGLNITGPTGSLSPTLTGIDGSCNNSPTLLCVWTYEQVFPQAGTYNLSFHGDPNNTTYGTDTLVVTAAPTSDQDGDGYDAPEDCDDTNPNIHPGAAEVCGNGIDEDCDGSDQSCLTDSDGDGYVSPHDCDDTNPEIHPYAAEICGNGIDEDCDGVDPPCASSDAGVSPDAATTTDGGGTVNPRTSSGCGCRTGTGTDTPPPISVLWLLALAALIRRRRNR